MSISTALKALLFGAIVVFLMYGTDNATHPTRAHLVDRDAILRCAENPERRGCDEYATAAGNQKEIDHE